MAKHSTHIDGFVSSYYLQLTSNANTAYSTPFTPTSVAENNAVLLAQLDLGLSKTAVMAITKEILALEEPNNPFDLESKDFVVAFDATTAQQDRVVDLSISEDLRCLARRCA